MEPRAGKHKEATVPVLQPATGAATLIVFISLPSAQKRQQRVLMREIVIE